MSITLTTSAGDVFSPVKELQFDQALRRLKPAAQGGLAFIYLVDELGNEITLTARGTLRVYFADNPGHCYALRQGLEHGVELCRRFMRGDMAWFESQAWERDLPLEEGEAAVSAPLPGVAPLKMPPPLPAVEAQAEAWNAEAEQVPEAAPLPCPRCGLMMKQGYLTVRVGRANLMVQWGTGGLSQTGWTTYIREPQDVRPVIAMRCNHCGHLEFRA